MKAGRQKSLSIFASSGFFVVAGILSDVQTRADQQLQLEGIVVSRNRATFEPDSIDSIGLIAGL